MMDSDLTGENIVQFTGKHKEPLGGRMLVPVSIETCRHMLTSYEVDVDAGKCKCLQCGAEVSPIFVLEQLMHKESQWMRTREAYIGEMQRLSERSKTKCQHCGKLTRISGR
jgi:DNA-directed RNA polymerase subunit RPC12/RpoP